MVDNKVKRIRPKDFELSSVQDNLANALDGVLDELNGPQDATVSRRTITMGTYYAAGAMPTSDASFKRAAVTDSGNAYTAMYAGEVMPVSGRVLSMQALISGTPKGQIIFTLYQNNKPSLVVSKSTQGPTSITTLTTPLAYAQGDLFFVCLRGTNSSETLTFSASIDVESAA